LIFSVNLQSFYFMVTIIISFYFLRMKYYLVVVKEMVLDQVMEVTSFILESFEKLEIFLIIMEVFIEITVLMSYLIQ
jgi:hypothetical protein